MSNCRITTRFVIGQFARAIEGRAILRKLTCSYRFGNVLLNFVLQPLRCATHVSTVTVARKFINDIALVRSRKHIFFACGRKSSSRKNDARLHREVTALSCGSDLLFEPHRNGTQPWKLLITRTFFWSV